MGRRERDGDTARSGRREEKETTCVGGGQQKEKGGGRNRKREKERSDRADRRTADSRTTLQRHGGAGHHPGTRGCCGHPWDPAGPRTAGTGGADRRTDGRPSGHAQTAHARPGGADKPGTGATLLFLGGGMRLPRAPHGPSLSTELIQPTPASRPQPPGLQHHRDGGRIRPWEGWEGEKQAKGVWGGATL